MTAFDSFLLIFFRLHLATLEKCNFSLYLLLARVVSCESAPNLSSSTPIRPSKLRCFVAQQQFRLDRLLIRFLKEKNIKTRATLLKQILVIASNLDKAGDN
jgi:hypothetical protein